MAAKKKTTRKKTTRKKTTRKKAAAKKTVEAEVPEPSKIDLLRIALEQARNNPNPDLAEIEAIEMALRAATEIPDTWFE